MPPPAIISPSTLDFSHPLADRDAVMRVNPHRHEFQLVDAVLFCDTSTGLFAGYHDVRPDAWWTRGHIPGRPLFPGVLMIEAAAQLCSFARNRMLHGAAFIGFVGVDDVKFRGTVEPPCRLVITGRSVEVKPRRFISDTQGFVGETMVFEGRITGMPV
ncbi:MAG TPA: beta-hydroxyacyl-ACP dehydratase [Phycisphaerae bacterium]|nr:beta-hydroxyacyl-ACP dehydratase [Phycisphaerae bacterium]